MLSCKLYIDHHNAARRRKQNFHFKFLTKILIILVLTLQFTVIDLAEQNSDDYNQGLRQSFPLIYIKPLNGSCDNDNECSFGAVCAKHTGRCQCPLNMTPGVLKLSCSQRLCHDNIDCVAENRWPNTHCEAGVCQCDSEYRADDQNVRCERKLPTDIVEQNAASNLNFESISNNLIDQLSRSYPVGWILRHDSNSIYDQLRCEFHFDCTHRWRFTRCADNRCRCLPKYRLTDDELFCVPFHENNVDDYDHYQNHSHQQHQSDSYSFFSQHLLIIVIIGNFVLCFIIFIVILRYAKKRQCSVAATLNSGDCDEQTLPPPGGCIPPPPPAYHNLMYEAVNYHRQPPPPYTIDVVPEDSCKTTTTTTAPQAEQMEINNNNNNSHTSQQT